MGVVFLLLLPLLPLPLSVHAEDLGELSASPYALLGSSLPTLPHALFRYLHRWAIPRARGCVESLLYWLVLFRKPAYATRGDLLVAHHAVE